MNPEFIVVSPLARSSYRSLKFAILEARRHRVPVLSGGKPVKWVYVPDGNGAGIICAEVAK